MGLLKRMMGDEPGASKSDFVDLAEYHVETTPKEEATACLVKVAEIHRHEDISDLAEQVYGGHILVLDIKAAVKDDFQLRRITAELKKIAADVGGDVAGIGENLLCVTPKGIKVDRQKIRVTA